MKIKIIPQFQLFYDNFSVMEISRKVVFIRKVDNENRAEVFDEIGQPPTKGGLDKNATMWTILLLGVGFILINEH